MGETLYRRAPGGIEPLYPRTTAARVRTSGGQTVEEALEAVASPATQERDGRMSAADKRKLDGIAERANDYELPVASAEALGGVRVGAGLELSEQGVLSVPGGAPGALLWQGSATSGSITVPGTGGYRVYGVVVGDSVIYRLVCARFGDTVHGVDFARSGGGNLHYHLTATVAGDVWTIARSYNSNGNAKPVTEVYGLG